MKAIKRVNHKCYHHTQMVLIGGERRLANLTVVIFQYVLSCFSHVQLFATL